MQTRQGRASHPRSPPVPGEPRRFLRLPLSDFIAPLVLGGLVLTSELALFRRAGVLIGDTGKEFGVPWELVAGKVLYRDVFWPYGPFPPIAHSLLFRAFGAHSDVLLLLAALLSAALVLTVYAAVRSFAGTGYALGAAICVLAFSATSNYVALPYSYATLWATVFSLLAALTLSLCTDPRMRRPSFLFAAAGCLTGMVLLCKFTVALALIPPAVLATILRSRIPAVSRGHTIEAGRISRALSWYAVCLAFAGVLPLGLAYLLTRPASFAFQAMGGFHLVNVRAGQLYSHLVDCLLWRDGISAENLATAGMVYCVLALTVASVVAGANRVRRAPGKVALSPAQASSSPSPFALFAVLNLSQLNSTVHAPYLFPAALIAFLASARHPRDAVHRSGMPRVAQMTLVLLLAFSLALAAGRMHGFLTRSVRIKTPTWDLWLAGENAQGLAATVKYIQAAVPPGRLLVSNDVDYLYFMTGRTNPFGFYYSYYEPFNVTDQRDAFLGRLAAASISLLVTGVDAFDNTYQDNVYTSVTGQGICRGFVRVDHPECEPFAIWVPGRPPPQTITAEAQGPRSSSSTSGARLPLAGSARTLPP